MRKFALAAMVTVSILGILSFRPTASQACIHPPATYEGTITTDTQEGIIFHDKGREVLILKAAYRINGKKTPENFAWVLTVPSNPDNYALADNKVFGQMFNWAEQYAPQEKSLYRAKNEDAQIIVEKKVEVGPYDIQPIRALGKDAAAALNIWFKANQYSEVKAEHLQYFIDNKMTFICVRVTPKQAEVHSYETGELPPLQISFASDKPYYPLKFFAFQGDMKLRLYTLTRKPVDFEASKPVLDNLKASGRYGLNNKVSASNFPAAAASAIADAKSGLSSKSGEWYFNTFDASGFNANQDILKWKSDVFLTLK